MTKLDCFKTLKLAPGSSLDEVKEQFRKMALVYHPDALSSDITQADRDQKETEFLKIKEAYEQILDTLSTEAVGRPVDS